MTSSIQVDLCRSSLTYCLCCALPIARDSLRVQIKSFKKPTVYYHLHCYQPATQRPILLDRDVILFNIRAEGDLRIVKDWADRWNRKFSTSENEVAQKFLKNSVTTSRPKAYRVLFEVFVYLTPSDIETRAAFICKEWLHVAREEDLWKTKFSIDFPTEDADSGSSFRATYIRLYHDSCWKCARFLPLPDISMLCPLHCRPICSHCAARKECEMTSLDWFGLRKYMAKDLPVKLGIRTFIHENVEKSYFSDLCDKIVPYAERRRNVLLTKLKGVSEATMKFVETFDFNKYYEAKQKHTRKEVVALATFCGRDDDGEEISRSIEEFLRMIRD